MRGDSKDGKNKKVAVVKRLRLLVYVGHQTVQRHLVRHVLRFFDNHDWCYVVAWSFVVAIPIPVAWMVFAYLLAIPNDVIRAVAVWLYFITFIILSAGKGYSEKSAIDHTLRA